MNIMIDGKWINLDNIITVTIVKLYEVLSDEYRETLRIGSTDTDDWIDIPMTAPGARSAWAWLQKAAIVFDETTDAELEPESAEKIYKVGDVIQFDTGHDIRTGIIEKAHTSDQSYEVQAYGFLVPQSDIIGLAPPESEAI